MYSMPDLMPRDSHTLWYRSSRNPVPATAPPVDPDTLGGGSNAAAALANGAGPHHRRATGNHAHPGSGGHHHHHHHAAASAAVIERSALGRLRADEHYYERRRLNVGAFGAAWLKPPGVGKSLLQLREERREAEEHAEALRREQMAQELAEAEAAGTATAVGGVDAEGEGAGAMPASDADGGEPMDGVDGGERDLDDDIPDADVEGFGYDGVESDDEDDEDDDDGTQRHAAAGAENQGARPGGAGTTSQQREIQNRVANMRATEDRVREMIARGQGDDDGAEIYQVEEDIDEEEQSQMLEEEDLIPSGAPHGGGRVSLSADLEMDVNLDDEIPEAASEAYEHSDTEADLSSGEGGDGSSLALPSARAPRTRNSLGRNQGARDSMDISSLLSRDGSSIVGSSPQTGRRRRA